MSSIIENNISVRRFYDGSDSIFVGFVRGNKIVYITADEVLQISKFVCKQCVPLYIKYMIGILDV